MGLISKWADLGPKQPHVSWLFLFWCEAHSLGQTVTGRQVSLIRKEWTTEMEYGGNIPLLTAIDPFLHVRHTPTPQPQTTHTPVLQNSPETSHSPRRLPWLPPSNYEFPQYTSIILFTNFILFTCSSVSFQKIGTVNQSLSDPQGLE